MAEKTPNYTPEQAAELVTAYRRTENDAERAAVVTEFAAEFGKTKRSIVAKLVSEGVYMKPTPTTKAGLAVERKAAIVEQIAAALEVPSEVVGSLESATKRALQLVRARLCPPDSE